MGKACGTKRTIQKLNQIWVARLSKLGIFAPTSAYRSGIASYAQSVRSLPPQRFSEGRFPSWHAGQEFESPWLHSLYTWALGFVRELFCCLATSYVAKAVARSVPQRPHGRVLLPINPRDGAAQGCIGCPPDMPALLPSAAAPCSSSDCLWRTPLPIRWRHC